MAKKASKNKEKASEHEGISDEDWDSAVLLGSVSDELNERSHELEEAFTNLDSHSETVNGYQLGLLGGLKLASELVMAIYDRAMAGREYWTPKPVHNSERLY